MRKGDFVLTGTSFRLQPLDATNVTFVPEVFRTVYGEAYVDSSVYQPEELLQKIDQGKLHAVLALAADGRPAGYAAIGAETPNPFLWEEMGLVVVPEYSNTDVGTMLVRFWADSFGWPARVEGLFGSTVCHHYFAQIFCAKAGWIASTLQLDLFDAAIFRDRPEGLSRVSCLQFFSPMPPASAPSYWPGEYCEFLATISGVRQEPPGILSMASLPVATATALETKATPSSRSLRVNVFRIGGDWPEVVRDIMAEAQRQRIVSIQMFLDTSCACIGEAVRILRAHGFFLGGLAPRWFGADGLLMQRVTADTRYDLLKLYSDPARQLFEFIRADREK
jgi:hypothetical protein